MEFKTDENMKWRIWNIDDKMLYLISETPTSESLFLQDILGYNNGVTLADTICSSCYGNKHYLGLVARNMKIDDITKITSHENTLVNLYGKQSSSYTSDYPYVWMQYESNSKEDAINNRSIAYDLTTEATISSTKEPFYVQWQNTDMKEVSNWSNPIYKELVLDVANENSYFLSSRFVKCYGANMGFQEKDYDCIFGLQSVNNSGVSGINLHSCRGSRVNSTAQKATLRPIVCIPLDSMVLRQNNDGIDFSIKAK